MPHTVKFLIQESSGQVRMLATELTVLYTCFNFKWCVQYDTAPLATLGPSRGFLVAETLLYSIIYIFFKPPPPSNTTRSAACFPF